MNTGEAHYLCVSVFQLSPRKSDAKSTHEMSRYSSSIRDKSDVCELYSSCFSWTSRGEGIFVIIRRWKLLVASHWVSPAGKLWVGRCLAVFYLAHWI